jgi:hypothetical protein
MITKTNSIEEACNDFASVNASIETIRNEIIQHYTIAQRLQINKA